MRRTLRRMKVRIENDETENEDGEAGGHEEDESSSEEETEEEDETEEEVDGEKLQFGDERTGQNICNGDTRKVSQRLAVHVCVTLAQF